MQKSEFECAVRKTVSDEAYDVIETVYMYYPKICSKEDAYWLFKTLGFAVFRDLYPRARKIADLENQVSSLKKEIEELQTKEVKHYETQ